MFVHLRFLGGEAEVAESEASRSATPLSVLSSAARAPPRDANRWPFHLQRNPHLSVSPQCRLCSRCRGMLIFTPAPRTTRIWTRAATCRRCENSQRDWANPGRLRKSGRACRRRWGAPWTPWWGADSFELTNCLAANQSVLRTPFPFTPLFSLQI